MISIKSSNKITYQLLDENNNVFQSSKQGKFCVFFEEEKNYYCVSNSQSLFLYIFFHKEIIFYHPVWNGIYDNDLVHITITNYQQAPSSPKFLFQEYKELKEKSSLNFTFLQKLCVLPSNNGFHTNQAYAYYQGPITDQEWFETRLREVLLIHNVTEEMFKKVIETKSPINDLKHYFVFVLDAIRAHTCTRPYLKGQEVIYWNPHYPGDCKNSSITMYHIYQTLIREQWPKDSLVQIMKETALMIGHPLIVIGTALNPDLPIHDQPVDEDFFYHMFIICVPYHILKGKWGLGDKIDVITYHFDKIAILESIYISTPYASEHNDIPQKVKEIHQSIIDKSWLWNEHTKIRILDHKHLSEYYMVKFYTDFNIPNEFVYTYLFKGETKVTDVLFHNQKIDLIPCSIFKNKKQFLEDYNNFKIFYGFKKTISVNDKDLFLDDLCSKWVTKIHPKIIMDLSQEFSLVYFYNINHFLPNQYPYGWMISTKKIQS